MKGNNLQPLLDPPERLNVLIIPTYPNEKPKTKPTPHRKLLLPHQFTTDKAFGHPLWNRCLHQPFYRDPTAKLELPTPRAVQAAHRVLKDFSVRKIMEIQLDSMILKFFSNLNDSVCTAVLFRGGSFKGDIREHEPAQV